MELIFYDMESLMYQKSGGNSTPERLVLCYEIEYQLNDGGVSYIDGKAYPIRGGQMLLAKPGMKRFTRGAYSCLAMHFYCGDENFAKELDQLPHTLISPNPTQAEELLWSAYKTRMDGESRTIRMEGLLLQILAEYMDASQLTKNTAGKFQEYADGIYRTVEYMKKNYAEHITSEILARQMFISTNFYQKVFKQIMGIPPAQFLRDIRISEACRLLANTDLPVQDVAEMCGFGCASYFIYVLKRENGITPSEYRRRNRTFI